jgi:hypothetical protein
MLDNLKKTIQQGYPAVAYLPISQRMNLNFMR